MATSSSNTLTRARVEALRLELKCDLERLQRSLRRRSASKVPTASGSLCCIVDTEYADAVSSGLYDRMEAQYAQTAEALDRISQGSYGRCAVCREPIPYERLLVVPETRTCVTCRASR
jgi:DnaK suppressor protein